MAINPAGTTRFRPATYRPPGRLWQVPVFFLGLLAVTVVCLARPPWRPIEAHRAERDLDALRQLLDQEALDRDQLLEAIQRLERHLERIPHRAAEVHFLLGSLHLRLAERGSPGESIEPARRARRHLEEAQALGVPETDRPRLTYRLGKALYLTHADLQTVIDHLARSVEKGADDPFEGYGLLAQAYLRLPRPDLEGALRATEKQLQLPIVSDDLLAPVRLLRGELLLRLQRPDEARQVLANIGAHAPAELRAQARFLRARSFQEEQRWDEAAGLWKEVVADRRQVPRELGWALYYLGVCCRQLDQPEDAARAWAECAGRADGGDEAVAAALGLAELRLAENSPAALEAFERALRDIKGPADWRNPLVDLDQARTLFERGCAAYREAGDFERSMQLARIYEKIAPPGVAALLRAQAADAGAAARAGEEAQALLGQAGAAYEESAEQAATAADRRERLWLSADRYRRGGDLRRAAAVLEQFLPTEEDPGRLGEGYFWLAEAHRALDNPVAAREAYLLCMRYQTPFAYRARYQVALMEMANGDIDNAVSMLGQILHQLSQEGNPGPEEEPRQGSARREAEEKSLYLLGSLLFQQRQYLLAAARLEQALHTYPDSPQAVRGRFLLAECHRHLAAHQGDHLKHQQPGSTHEAQKHFEKEYHKRLSWAAQEYQQLIDTLARRPPQSLTAEEQGYLRQALFGIAEARFNLGDYDGALNAYEQLAARYPRRVDEVYALAKVFACRHAKRAVALQRGDQDGARHEEEQARAALNRFRAALQALDDKAFEGEDWTRQDWERWLATVGSP
ncbi:MAG TPA: tetratricopeptide repeat protein [Gemmataceae bacterium]|nr:tetratricopeptide repeat protein [Gemmataceae bacterium]